MSDILTITTEEISNIEQFLLPKPEKTESKAKKVRKDKGKAPREEPPKPVADKVAEDITDIASGSGRLPMKQKLIDDIIKVELGKDSTVDVAKMEKLLKTQNISHLKIKLGSLVDTTVKGINGKPELTRNELFSIEQNKQINSGAEILFQMNSAVAQVMESLTSNYKAELGYHLEGFNEDLNSKKEELMPILAAIFKENQADIGAYVSPYSAYALVMCLSAIKSVRKSVDDQIEGEKKSSPGAYCSVVSPPPPPPLPSVQPLESASLI